MIKGINVELSIKDNETGRYLLIPQLPATIAYTDGSTTAQTLNIIDLGDVDIPDGVGLDTFGWSSDFPARYDPGYVTTADLLRPNEYKDQFSEWKDKRASLQLICPAAGINKTMYLSSFDWELKGFEGDIGYTVDFKELKTIRPRKISTAGMAPPRGKRQPQDRPPQPRKPKPKTYTVVPGDTLIKIAKRLGIANWRTGLYQPNKSVIGSNPNLIYPGQVYKV